MPTHVGREKVIFAHLFSQEALAEQYPHCLHTLCGMLVNAVHDKLTMC